MTETPRRYLDPRILAATSSLELRARIIAEGLMVGRHRSPYRGESIEFAEHRPYAPGDETRRLDWRVWARSDRYYVKLYEAETNLPVTLLVDATASMRYGREEWRKFDCAATLAASLAHVLLSQQDAVGLHCFGAKATSALEPASRPDQIHRLCAALEKTEPGEPGSSGDDLAAAVERIKRRGLVVLISDLFWSQDAFIRTLKQLRHRGHEVSVFHLLHSDERYFPFDQPSRFEGLESNAWADLDPSTLRRAYIEAVEAFLAERRQAAVEQRADYVALTTDEPLDSVLHRYIAARRFGRHGTRRT